MKRPGLVAAYTAARYCIDCAGQPIERRIGVVDAQADRCLAESGCRHHWHVLTPCNPGSRQLPAADNQMRLDALRDHLSACAWRTLPSVNRADNGEWEEPGYCILDAPPEEIVALACRYGQLALVGAELGAPPALIWTGVTDA